MSIEFFSLTGLRNLKPVKFSPSQSLNIIYGENGSGKTSLLEAIHILSRAKSFRTHHIKNVVTRDHSQFSIFSKIVISENQSIPLGVEFTQGLFRMKAAGVSLKRVSELVSMLPVAVMHQESIRMITDGPKYRKKFLDNGVFHVEHQFLPQLKRYMRALKQRNITLQSKARNFAPIRVWNTELKESALNIHLYRSNYLEDFKILFSSFLKKLLNLDAEITLNYRPGWNVDNDYEQMLDDGLDLDIKRGYTYYGPHRADLVIRVDNTVLHEFVSRGQLKQTVCALILAQAAVYQKKTGQKYVLLFDDLTAEFDDFHIKTLMELAAEINCQMFVTTTEIDRLRIFITAESKTFHVEHGIIKEVV